MKTTRVGLVYTGFTRLRSTSLPSQTGPSFCRATSERQWEVKSDTVVEGGREENERISMGNRDLRLFISQKETAAGMLRDSLIYV